MKDETDLQNGEKSQTLQQETPGFSNIQGDYEHGRAQRVRLKTKSITSSLPDDFEIP